MVTNLRDAKGRLSELVQRAAQGEEILITVRGEPLARLTGVKSESPKSGSLNDWVAELKSAAEAVRTGQSVTTPQEFWDELRADRTER